MTGAERVLCELLSCGSMDLKMLDDVALPWDDVLENSGYAGGAPINFNDLMRAVVDLGVVNITCDIEERISELEACEELNEDDANELKQIKKLNPENDIASFFNCKDTHIWFEKNGDIYRQYFPETLDEFVDNTGFEIG